MRDLYITRNELIVKSKKLKEQKFDPKLNQKQVGELIKKQNEVYKLYKF